MRTPWLLLIVAVVVGCKAKPDYLSRAEGIDELCPDGKKSAYSYLIDQPDSGVDKLEVPASAVKWGCVAPTAAWTDHRDKKAGGARAKVHALREEGRTILCCKE